MSDKPIIFSAPMVRALLEGRKTQTRRVIKKPAALDALAVFGPKFLLLPGNRDLIGYAPGDRLYVREHWRGHIAYDDLAPSAMGGEEPILYLADSAAETWGWGKANPATWGRFRQGMHMPRWASRITLTVTDVRVQRLQDISEADAWAEGCKPGALNDHGEPFPAEEPAPDGKGEIGWDCARDWYADLWDSLHGPEAWDANPWVAAYSFVCERRNIDDRKG